DPEKLIIQTDYDNDAKPARVSAQTLFNDSLAAFNKGEYAQAETKLKEAARADADNALIRAWLARTLAAQKKNDEAATEANAALKIVPAVGAASAWAHITLGQLALARGDAAEAARNLRRAIVETDEAPAQYAAREALAQAEKAANLLQPVEESIRAWVAQLDSLIKQPSSDRLYAIIVRENLKQFVQGLTVTPPTAWATEILRADKIDANRVALDVALRVTADRRDLAGTAVFVLYRSGSGWMLEDVQLFNVK
ncbi:MAG TPA: tetratricopeptide repeat protein, partial [Blastocatellia bacterium]|nr:tetratricopeptide repeat protein [Blastocatellia bacterium]